MFCFAYDWNVYAKTAMLYCKTAKNLFMFLSFATIIVFLELFLNALVGFLNSSFKFAGMLSLFIPLYTGFSIDESIRSSSSSH